MTKLRIVNYRPIMKRFPLKFFIFLFTINISQAQVGIGTESPDTSSILELSSTSKGFLVPRMTDAQKNAISSPAQGLLFYRTDGGAHTQGFYYKDNWWWKILATNDNKSFYIGDVKVGAPSFGSQNTAFGNATFAYATSGSNNTAMGFFALSSSNGSNNTAVGENAMRQGQSNVNGSYNTAIGSQALSNGDSGGYNTAIGALSIKATEGDNNSGLGYRTLINNTTGDDNTSVGYNSGVTNTTGSNNTLMGSNADVSSNNLSNATAIGANATVNASNKIQLGDSNVTNIETSATFTAGAVTYPNTDGTNGQVLKTDGSGALSWTTVSSGATDINDLADAVVSNQETIIIGSTPNVGTEARYSTGVGKRVLEKITTGDENVAMGHQALGETTTGSYNTAMGSHVNFRNTTGNFNSSFGVRVLENTSTGSSNTGIGASAGDTNTTGSNNTFIGRGSDANANNLSNATALGYNAIVNASNKIQLGDSNVTLVETSGTVSALAFVGDGSGLTNLPASTIQTPIEASSITINSTHHGRIFYSQHSNRPALPNPDTLPAGFMFTVVNYSNYEGKLSSPTNSIVGVRSPNLYQTSNHTGANVSVNNNNGVGSKAFPVNEIGFMSGGTIQFIVIPISGSNFYYVNGDYYYPNN